MATVPQLGEVPRSLTQDAFWGLFGRIEHPQLDFKRGVSADVRDTIAAMAMSEGGLIVHGVDDQRRIARSVAGTCPGGLETGVVYNPQHPAARGNEFVASESRITVTACSPAPNPN